MHVSSWIYLISCWIPHRRRGIPDMAEIRQTAKLFNQHFMERIQDLVRGFVAKLGVGSSLVESSGRREFDDLPECTPVILQ